MNLIIKEVIFRCEDFIEIDIGNVESEKKIENIYFEFRRMCCLVW